MMRKLIKFCSIGALGFVVDIMALQLIITVFKINPYSARVFSFLIAASFTWILNRSFTFQVKSTHRMRAEWLSYMGLMALGAGINYVTYVFCVKYFLLSQNELWIGVAAGSIAGLGANFTSSLNLYKNK